MTLRSLNTSCPHQQDPRQVCRLTTLEGKCTHTQTKNRHTKQSFSFTSHFNCIQPKQLELLLELCPHESSFLFILGFEHSSFLLWLAWSR